MSKIPKWKIEKAKVKVVFRLQFHATHVPQSGWDKLFLSFIPAETGKPSAKTNKANVRNGNCKWSDPIYEATRLLQDTRTKKYDDKIYKLIIAMGSSRAAILGDADLNLAEFVDALKPSSIALPLHGCDCGTVLHVTVQILTTKTGFREFEQQNTRGPQMVSSSPPDIVGPSSGDKTNAKGRLRETNSESTEDGIDGSSHTSDSLQTEKTEIPLFPLTRHPSNSLKDDFTLTSRALSPQGSNDWTPSWGSDLENNDLALAYDENNRLRARLEVAESAFLQLKSEAKSLQRITDELGAETEGLACQMAAELDSGQTLVREVTVLKTECSNLKKDVRELELAKLGNRFLSDKGLGSQALVLIENKVHEIRDKACLGFEFLDSDFESLLIYLDGLKKGLKSHDGSGLTQEEDPLVKKEKMCELLQKLEDSKTENEILVNKMNQMEKKMNQMERYYESYIHQVEESQKQTVKELETVREENSSSVYTTSLLQSQIEKLHEEMNGQMVRFVEERKELEKINEEMEKRAVASETALKRVRRNYTTAVERLQKDLELLSFQVLSMYECNEIPAKQHFVDSDPNSNLNSETKNQICSNGDGYVGLEEERMEEKPRCIEIRANTDEELVDLYVGMVQLRVFSDLLVGALNIANNEANQMKKRKYEMENEFLESKKILKVKLENVTEERDRFESLLVVEITEKKHFEAKMGALVEESRVLREEIDKLIAEKEKLKDVELDLEASRRILLEGNEEKENFESQIGVMVQQIKALKEESDNVNQEKKMIEEMKVSFENKWREAELNLEGSRTKLEFSSEVIESLQKELQDVTEKFDVSESAELQKRENNDLMAKLKLVEIELEQVNDENKCLVQNLTEKNVNLENSVKKTELNLQEVMEKFEAVSEAEERQTRENGELMEKIELLEMELRKVTGESHDLMCKLKESGGIGEELERTKANLECCKEENEALEIELKNLREMKVNLESDLEASKRNLNVSRNTIEKNERELFVVRESFSVSSEAEQLHVRSNSDLLSKLELLDINLVNCEEEKRDLQDELRISEKTKFEFENLLKKAESELGASLIKMDLSSKTIEKLERELNEVREIHAKNNADLVAKLELLEIKLKDSDDVREELEKTKLSLVNSKEETRNLENELGFLEKAKVDFENSLRRVEGDLEDSIENLDFSEKKVQNLRRELQEVTDRFEKDNLELKSKLDFVQFESEQFRNECDDLKIKLQESENSRDELERNKEILENEIVELNLKLSDINVQVEEREKEMVLFSEEKTKLREIISDIEKANISMQNVMLRNEENQTKFELEFENRLILILEELVASDAEANYMKSLLFELNSKFNLLKNGFQKENEISAFKDMIETLEKEVESLRFSKEEMEILNVILRSKLEEQDKIISALKQSRSELGDMRENHRVLTRRLSEQTLKTEEYKSLSLHFKEKSEEQSINQAIEKRETESLRIAFIKEQYESKIQEMKSQILVSKNYTEEMLVKLQNSLDEVETGKKNEISLAKRIEELSISLSEMETEMQEIRIDRRELVCAYDNLKTELECTILSFDCCKEEKAKLEACFQECNEERRKIKVELDLVKRLMENMAMAGNGDVQSNESNGSIGELLEARSIGEDGERGAVERSSIVGSPIKSRALENDAIDDVTKDEHSEKHQKLKIALSLFQKELEKLKNENISFLIPQDGGQMDPSLHGLERALSQLDMANEHLGSIFPSFKELSGSGNALERVLALELELVEALQQKKRTETRFQSSFLKQHNDEEAIFQSFRDINELIQDMLELKKSHVNVESELREMHGRYSQLSLQFAEVEGERQKLMMSLKNRSPRKSL